MTAEGIAIALAIIICVGVVIALIRISWLYDREIEEFRKNIKVGQTVIIRKAPSGYHFRAKIHTKFTNSFGVVDIDTLNAHVVDITSIFPI